MQLSQKQLHQKTSNRTTNIGPCISFCSCLWRALGKTSSQSGLCISEKSLRDLLLPWVRYGIESGKQEVFPLVCMCACVLKLFFCWEHNCAFWFWRLLAKEPRSIVISNGPMESDTQSWLVHSEHPCINFPSGQQCVWCGASSHVFCRMS